MMITPFSVFLIVIVIVLFIRSGNYKEKFLNLFALELIFAINKLNLGYFIKADMEIQNDDVLLGILFMMSIYIFLKSKKMSSKLKYAITVFLLFLVGNIVYLFLDPANVKVVDYNHSWDLYVRGDSFQLRNVNFSMQSILMSFRVIIYVAILGAASIVMSTVDYLKTGMRIYAISKYLLLFGAIEAVLKYVFHFDISEYLIAIFGRGVSQQGSIERLQGLCREPAYYAIALGNFIYLSIFLYFIEKPGKRKKGYIMWSGLAVFLSLISSSFSSLIVLLGVFLTFYAIRRIEKNRKIVMLSVQNIVIILLLLAIFCFMFSEQGLQFIMRSDVLYANRIAQSISMLKLGFSGMYMPGSNLSSEAARLIGITTSLSAGLFNRPFMGLGIGTVYCCSGIVSIIANIGLIGFIMWFNILFVRYSKIREKVIAATLLIPIILCNDMYSLYDTTYLLFLPLLGTIINNMKHANFANYNNFQRCKNDNQSATDH